MKRLLVLVACLLPCAAGLAHEIDFIEDFALAPDRATALRQLIPTTEEYYFFHALHYLNTEQHAKAAQLFTAWRDRFGQTARLNEIQMRHALLTYDRQPQPALNHIRHALGLRYDHQRIDASKSPDLPTRLDPKHIDRETLKQISLSRWSSLENFEDAALEWLAGDNLNWERRRELLRRLSTPDLANLIQLIDLDLREQQPQPFGSHPIHRQLTLDQLEQLVRLRPNLLNDQALVQTWLVKLQPGADEDQRDPAVTRAWFDRMLTFVRRLASAHNSLKAHVLFHRLAFDRTQGQMSRELFFEYLKLPRQQPYMSRAMLEAAEGRRAQANLGADFAAATQMPPIGSDEPLVRAYLEHFLLAADSPQEFAPYINDQYLRHLFAEVKIVNGLGEPESWAAQLPPALYQQIKERIDIDFAPTNRVQFAAEEPVSLDLFVKNVPTLLVQVYEINTHHWYRTHLQEVDTTINLDGLVAHNQTTTNYTDAPQRRIARKFDFPMLNKPGVYVVDFIGGGMSSRAVIRKGRLRPLVQTPRAGVVVGVADEAPRPGPTPRLGPGGRESPADADGHIVVPFSTSPSTQPIVLATDAFACLDSLDHKAEAYQLAAGIYVDREALLPQRLAAIVVRPTLRLGDIPVSLKELEKVPLRLLAVDQDGVADFKLFDDRESIYEFRVPARLARLTVELRAQVQSHSLGKPVDVAASAEFQINGIDQKNAVMDFHLARFGSDYVLESLGRTGEIRGDLPVTVALKHRLFREPISVTLKSDAKGRIVLGPLVEIESVRLKTPGDLWRDWRLPRDLCLYPATIHAVAGTAVTVPYLSSSTAPNRAELALFEVERDVIRTDHFDKLALANGLLELRDLAPGDYLLWLKQAGPGQGTRILVRITAGPVQASHALGAKRSLELPRLKPVTIASLDSDAQHLTIRLRDVSPFARVHLFATRYVPEFPPFARLQIGDLPGLTGTVPAVASVSYITGRNIGDEYRYVLDRRLAPKHPGNMLDRPALLLNPWAKRNTFTGEQLTGRGQGFGVGSAEAPSMRMRAESPEMDQLGRSWMVTGPVGPEGSPNIDFLGDAAGVLLNLVPNDSGEIKVPRDKLGRQSQIHVVAVDPLHTTYRTLTLPETPTRNLDLRLAKGLAPAGHFTQQKQVTVLQPRQSFVLEDAVGSRFQAYASLDRVYGLYATLLKDPRFAEFSFITRWPTLKPEEQRALYSKHACHELNFFLYKKDPEFFQRVVRPYLANKKDKTFVDRWLLEEDLKDYVEPWRHGRLNAFERVLLAQRLPGEAEATARHLLDLWRLQPRDLNREQFLFGAAVATSSLDADDALGVRRLEEVAKLRAPAEQERKDSGDKKEADAPNRVPAPPVPESAAAPSGGGAGGGGDLQFGARIRDANESRRNFDYSRSIVAGAAAPTPLYLPVEVTREWAENNYHQRPIQEQVYDLIPTSPFWTEYAKLAAGQPAHSTQLPQAARSFAEAMCALAVLDLPFTAPAPEIQFDGPRMTWTAAGHAIVFHEEVKPATFVDGAVPILVSQHFFRQDDRYRQVDGERVDRFVTDEFLTHVVYGCQVVVTNPTPARQKLAVLFQIPVGALPLVGGQATRSVLVDLEPYRTQLLDFHFYFPEPGQFAHFPVHVAKNEQLVASASSFSFNVVATPSKQDTESWGYVSQDGTPEQVLAFLQRENVHALDLDQIAWRMKDKAFFVRTLELLAARHVYHPTLWSYGLFHNDPAAIQQFLQHHPQIALLCGGPIRSPLLVLDTVDRHEYEHLEYRPLVNARAHSLGKRRQIVNAVLHAQYHQFLKQLSYQPQIGDTDRLALVYYLLLQDRIDEAQAAFSQVSKERIVERMQYDYCAAYLALFTAEPTRARSWAAPHLDHPVERWRLAFAAVVQQLDEIEGKAVAAVDPTRPDQRQGERAAQEPSFDFALEGRVVALTWQNLEAVDVNFYLMDVELLFSQNPFVQQGGEQFRAIRPNRTQTVKLPAGQDRLNLPLPEELIRRNVLVEVTAAGKARSLPYYSSALAIQMSENFGQVRVTGPDGRPLPKVYVKTYARLQNGTVKFHKDGYTDHRGRFDYATVSAPDQAAPERFAILLLSEEHGAQIREAVPPPR